MWDDMLEHGAGGSGWLNPGSRDDVACGLRCRRVWGPNGRKLGVEPREREGRREKLGV